MLSASDLSQLLPGQTLGIMNADGSITQINPSQVSVASSMAQSLKPITSVAGQSVSLAQGTQIMTQSQAGQSNITYSFISPQQLQSLQGSLQTVQIDGQEALYIPASSLAGGQQTFQIAGNQLISSPNQTIVRAQNQANSNANQQQVLQGLQGGVQYAQLANGQTVQVRNGNVMQTIQLPIQNAMQQQTVPVQIPISTNANGQTIMQTIQLPLSALQALSGGNQQLTAQLMPQLAQVSSGDEIFVC